MTVDSPAPEDDAQPGESLRFGSTTEDGIPARGEDPDAPTVVLAPAVELRIVEDSRHPAVEFHHRLRSLAPVPWVTYSLVAANVLVYVVNVLCGLDFMSPAADKLVDWGAEYGPRTLAGEWWRMLSSAFLHAGLVHVAVNMFVLADVGPLTERLFGHAGFLLLYVFTAITGAIASLWWNPCVVGVGASGAVFGVFGATLGLTLVRNETIPRGVLSVLRSRAATLLVLNLVIGLSVPMIDNAAHIGGFVGGVLFGALLSRPIVSGRGHHLTSRDFGVLVFGSALLAGVALLVLPPAPGDYFRAIDEFSTVEPRVMEDIEAAQTELREQRLAPVEFEQRVNDEILPRWKRAMAGLENLEGLVGRPKRVVELLTEYADTRYRMWTLQADTAPRMDLSIEEVQRLTDEVESLGRQGDALINRLESLE